VSAQVILGIVWVRAAGDCLRLCRSNICELPFKIFLQIFQALEGDFELIRGVERRRIVEDLNI
jgi:hypothetical protein